MPVVTTRQLHRFDRDHVHRHFERLDPQTIASRFQYAVHPDAVRAYAVQLLERPGLVLGTFVDGHLRGLAELRPLPDGARTGCEVAFVVERAFQNHGVGDALLTRLVRVAQNRSIRDLHLLCAPDNEAMLRLARKHQAQLQECGNQVKATLKVPQTNPFSLMYEAVGEAHAYFTRFNDVLYGAVPGPKKAVHPQAATAFGRSGDDLLGVPDAPGAQQGISDFDQMIMLDLDAVAHEVGA